MSILKSTFTVSLLIFISRVCGYVRDVVVSSIIGINVGYDVFIIAFKFANIFRYICGENIFNNILSPLFSALLKDDKKEKFLSLGSSIQCIILLFMLVASLLVFLLIPYIGTVLAPGFWRDPQLLWLLTDLVRIMIPYTILISLSAFYGTILNSYGAFFAHPLVQIILNVAIFTLFPLFYDFGKSSMHVLSYIVVFGQLLGSIFIFYYAKRKNLLVPIRAVHFNEEIKGILSRFLFTGVGVGTVQINVWINTIILSFVPAAISCFYFADRLIQIPLALIGETLVIVMMPFLSKAIANSLDLEEAKKVACTIYNYGLKLSFFFAIPSVIGLYILSDDIIYILFAKSKKINHILFVDISTTVKILVIAVLFFLSSKKINMIFYAFKDAKSPVFVSWIQLFTNTFLSLLLVRKYGCIGAAISTLISASVSTFLSFYLLRKKYGLYIEYSSFIYILKCCFMTFIMVSVVLSLKSYILQYGFLGLCIVILLGFCTYCCMALFLNMISPLKKKFT